MTTKKTMAFCLFVLFYAVSYSTTVLGFSPNSVQSHDIGEADGTTGQDTNNGTGVKTDHIQDGAVTTTKISDGAVTAGKVSVGSITAEKIADGAVTDAKITGPIAASKISSAGLNADTVDGQHAADLAPAVHTHSQAQVTGLEADLAGKSDVAHNHDLLYQKKYGKVAVVAQTGGDYTSPVTAMNDRAAWCGTPSASNSCLLKIMPGVYDLAGGSLQTQAYVDVEGSGENATVLRSSSAVVQCTDNVEVRLLTAESVGSSPKAFYLWGASRLTHVTARASGATFNNIGIDIASGAAPVLTNVTVDVQGNQSAKTWGINMSMVAQNTIVALNSVTISAGNGGFNYALGVGSGVLEMNNVTAKAYGGPSAYSSRGMWVSGGSVAIRNSTISGDFAGISVNPLVPVSIQNSIVKGTYSLEYGDAMTKISLSQLDGPFSGSNGLTCFNVYDANFMPVACP